MMSSDYEKARAANIKRNEDFLKDIGLNALQQDMRATSAAPKRPSSRDRDRDRDRKRVRVRRAGEEREAGEQGGAGAGAAPRRSRRLQNPSSSSSGSGSADRTEEQTFMYLNDGHGE